MNPIRYLLLRQSQIGYSCIKIPDNLVQNPTSCITSDEDAPEKYERYDRGDRSADPGEVVPNALFMDEIVEAIEVLPAKQREILYRSCGIRCMACGRVGNRETYAELANRFELYSESAVEKIRKVASKTLYEKFSYIKESL